MARQNGDTHQERYVPTTIKAAQLAQLKAKQDTTIIGSTVSGKKVEVDTGRALHMQSLQDVDNFKEHSKSAGFSISSKPNFKDPTGSISASVGSKGKANSITQSAISDGILTVDGKEIDTKTINTNTENTLHQLDKIFDKKKIEERQELARLFAKNAYEQLHNWQPTTKEGKIAKAFAHGVIGEWAARMAGNAPGSGFKATMTNELLIEKIKQIADNDPALAQWLSAAVGGVVNKVTGGSVNTGAAVSSYSTKWNELAQNTGDREIVRESEVPVNVREFYKEYKEDVEGSIDRKATEEAIKQLAKYNIRNDIGQVKIYFNVYDGVRFLGRVSLVVTVADTAYRIGEFKYYTQPRTDEERKNWLEFYEFDK